MSNLWQWAKEKTRTTMYALSGRTETEKMVLEATNDEKWGPTNAQMEEISRLSFHYEDCENIKKVIWERLGQVDDVRGIQKSLILLEYLLRNGHESFRSETNAMSRTLQSLSSLSRYQIGENAALEAVIRKKAKDILILATDSGAYKTEREKANKIKQKVYHGGSAGGGYFGSSMGNNYSNYSNPNYDSYSHNYQESNQLPSRQKQQTPPPKQQNQDNDYEYEYDDDGPPTKQSNQQQGFNPYPTQQSNQQQGFNPYPTQQSNQQQGFNPYPTQQSNQQQGFNPYPTQQSNQQQGFNPYPTQQPSQQPEFNTERRQPRNVQSNGSGLLPPPPGMPIRQPLQQPIQNQVNQPAVSNNLLDFSPSNNNQQPVDDLLNFGTPIPSAQPTQQQTTVDDLLNF